MHSRRKFIQKSITGGAVFTAGIPLFNINSYAAQLQKDMLGHGDFQYRIEREWSKTNSNSHPVNNCHEMVLDRKNRLILLTDHPKNNVLVYDTSGKILVTWTLGFSGAHGLSISKEGGEEFLFITDTGLGKVVKCTMDGKILMELDHPGKIGAYSEQAFYRPTETAIGPNGDIYVADGYGSQFILQFDKSGQFIRKFGGDSFLQPDKFKQAHGVAIDYRDPSNPSLLCSARIKNTFKRFTLEGEYLEDIYLPGAFISRPVLDDENLYSGVCFGMERDNYNMHLNKGFVTILDKDNKVVSNPGGTKPVYKKGKLELMFQEEPIFKHCHDVCLDRDKNLYVCQWNADGVYPYKLHRV
ncbi:peptidylglycine monooxygenase-like protein [Cyclobacterium sediminis]